MRCPGSDRHFCHTVTCSAELDGPQVIVEVRGHATGPSARLCVRGRLRVSMAHGSRGVSGISHGVKGGACDVMLLQLSSVVGVLDFYTSQCGNHQTQAVMEHLRPQPLWLRAQDLNFI